MRTLIPLKPFNTATKLTGKQIVNLTKANRFFIAENFSADFGWMVDYKHMKDGTTVIMGMTMHNNAILIIHEQMCWTSKVGEMKKNGSIEYTFMSNESGNWKTIPVNELNCWRK